MTFCVAGLMGLSRSATPAWLIRVPYKRRPTSGAWRTCRHLGMGAKPLFCMPRSLGVVYLVAISVPNMRQGARSCLDKAKTICTLPGQEHCGAALSQMVVLYFVSQWRLPVAVKQDFIYRLINMVHTATQQ